MPDNDGPVELTPYNKWDKLMLEAAILRYTVPYIVSDSDITPVKIMQLFDEYDRQMIQRFNHTFGV